MTELYKRIMQHAEKDEERLALAEKVWSPTPFVVAVYIGERNDIGIGEDEHSFREYCVKHFGKQSWPIHDKPANWYRGGATVNGWTWFGFKTKEMMDKFVSDWPENTKQKEVT